jgi:hypothetical protein
MKDATGDFEIERTLSSDIAFPLTLPLSPAGREKG